MTTKLTELVVLLANVAVITKVVVGVRAVGIPDRAPVLPLKLSPVGSVPVKLYETAEKPGTGLIFMVWPGCTHRGLDTPYDRIENGNRGMC